MADIGEQELPPGYLPLRVPVQVRVTQRVAVDVTLRTSDGVQLGEPVRLSVHANAYGKVLKDPVLAQIAGKHQATVAQVALELEALVMRTLILVGRVALPPVVGAAWV